MTRHLANEKIRPLVTALHLSSMFNMTLHFVPRACSASGPDHPIIGPSSIPDDALISHNLDDNICEFIGMITLVSWDAGEQFSHL